MRCVIYSRVSTADQSYDNQINQLKEYAAKQDWAIVDIKSDIASGGKSAEEREGLKEVFALAHRKKFDVLLFWSLDRFSREGSRKTLEYLTRLDGWDVKWHSYTEPYISSLGIFSDAIIAILSCLAKQERVRISERTRAGLDRVKSKGTKLGRPKIDPTIIAQAQTYKANGHSLAEIARTMNLSKSRVFQLCAIPLTETAQIA